MGGVGGGSLGGGSLGGSLSNGNVGSLGVNDSLPSHLHTHATRSGSFSGVSGGSLGGGGGSLGRNMSGLMGGSNIHLDNNR